MKNSIKRHKEITSFIFTYIHTYICMYIHIYQNVNGSNICFNGSHRLTHPIPTHTHSLVHLLASIIILTRSFLYLLAAFYFSPDSSAIPAGIRPWNQVIWLHLSTSSMPPPESSFLDQAPPEDLDGFGFQQIGRMASEGSQNNEKARQSEDREAVDDGDLFIASLNSLDGSRNCLRSCIVLVHCVSHFGQSLQKAFQSFLSFLNCCT